MKVVDLKKCRAMKKIQRFVFILYNILENRNILVLLFPSSLAKDLTKEEKELVNSFRKFSYKSITEAVVSISDVTSRNMLVTDAPTVLATRKTLTQPLKNEINK